MSDIKKKLYITLATIHGTLIEMEELDLSEDDLIILDEFLEQCKGFNINLEAIFDRLCDS